MNLTIAEATDSIGIPGLATTGFRFVLYKDCFDNKPTPGEEASFEAFFGQVVEDGHRRGPHKDGAAFSPVSYRNGTTRALANVDQVYAVGLDVEHVTPARAAQLFEAIAGLEFLAYTTHSHTEDDPRWRIVIALTRPVPARLYPRLWERVVELVGADAVDPSTKDASRLFYLPAARDGAPAELKYNSGAGVTTLDPVEALELTEEQFATALAQNAAPSLVPPAPPVNIVDGLIEKTGTLALKPRPTVADLKARVMACQPNQWRSNIEALFADQPFATAGGRDAAAHGCASTIAWVAPEADVDDLAQLFEKSVAAMWAANTSTSNPPPTMDEVRNKLRRAINERRERWYEERAFMETAHALAAVAAAPAAPQVAAPTIGAAAYYGLAAEIVKLIEPHSEADPVALLAQQLVAFGNAVGRGPHFRVESDEHHCNTFIVLVGRTAKGRKGTSWGRVQRVMHHADPVWTADRVKGGLSSGEGLIFEVRDEVKEFDKKKGCEVVIGAGVDDKRLLCYEPEYANVLKVCRREGNTLSPVVRNAWDQGNLRAMTKTSRTAATGAHISIVGHVTAGELRRYMTETELGNGFANRFVFFQVERSKCLPEGGSLADLDLVPFAMRVRAAILFARGVAVVRRDAQATVRWHEVYPQLSAGEDTLAGALTSRAEAHVMRFALLYALLDCSNVIRLEHLEAALALWAYSEQTCRRVFGDQLGDPVADELLRALRLAPDGLSRTDITRVVFGGHKHSADIGIGLAALVRRGLAVCVPVNDTGGRPGELWRATKSGTS